MGKYREVNEELIALVQQKKTGKEISKILNLDYSTVHSKLRKLGIHLYNYHNELKFDNTVFDTIDTEEKAYWLGFLYADGNVKGHAPYSVELSLKVEDYNHLIKYSNFLKYNKEEPVKIYNSSYNGKLYKRCRCIATDKHFHNRLIELGCVPNKSLILTFPDLSIFKEKTLINDFIRGYIDGDGCLSYSQSGRLIIQILGTKEFLDKIIELYPNTFGIRRKDKRRPNSNTFAIRCCSNKADNFAKQIYGKANIYLDRKYNRFAVLCRNV